MSLGQAHNMEGEGSLTFLAFVFSLILTPEEFPFLVFHKYMHLKIILKYFILHLGAIGGDLYKYHLLEIISS